MKKKIDITNWREVVDFVIDCQDQKASKHWTKEKQTNSLREAIKEEIEYLWNNGEINTRKWDECCWNDDVNKEFKEFFNVSNEFQKNSKVDDEDYLLTDYELKKKYGQDWYDDNFYSVVTSIKEDLSIDQLESLASLMKEGYYGFWSYEIWSNDIGGKGFIVPNFHQYSTSKYSEYMYDQRKFENFKVEVKEQNSSKTQKLTM